MDLVAIQQMLGHWHVGTTMRYVQPSSTFVEDAYVRAISDTLAELEPRRRSEHGGALEAADGRRATRGLDRG